MEMPGMMHTEVTVRDRHRLSCKLHKGLSRHIQRGLGTASKYEDAASHEIGRSLTAAAGLPRRRHRLLCGRMAAASLFGGRSIEVVVRKLNGKSVDGCSMAGEDSVGMLV
jgi:hypothetical protein